MKAFAKFKRFLFLIFCLCIAVRASADFCNPPFKIEWPAQNPVWTFCWLPPNLSSGPDGSGIEFRYVRYKDKLVLWRMNMPVLNVIYDPTPTACGPTFRDWLNELVVFQANNVVSPGYAEPTVPPVTVCDNPGTDVGTFQGVAVEKLNDKMVFTSQMQAGWYRYIMKVTFFQNGDIEPQFGFTAIDDPCIFQPHRHHGYWRFDFDIDGAANDIVQEKQDFGIPLNFSKETTRLRDYTVGRKWLVVDKNTDRGIEIFPGPNDGVGGDRFGGPDLWALRYHPDEKDDGGANQFGQNPRAQHITPYVNGEVIKSQDVVLWYRIGHYHASGPQCMLLGPKIHLVGNW